jgi:hypothetical protein
MNGLSLLTRMRPACVLGKRPTNACFEDLGSTYCDVIRSHGTDAGHEKRSAKGGDVPANGGLLAAHDE